MTSEEGPSTVGSFFCLTRRVSVFAASVSLFSHISHLYFLLSLSNCRPIVVIRANLGEKSSVPGLAKGSVPPAVNGVEK